MSTPVVLILGSGPRIGEAVSTKFAANGYKVAQTSRKGTNSIDKQGYLSLQADLANPDPSVLAGVFEKVKSEFKVAPSVVIYNAGSLTPPPVAESPLSIPSARVINDLNINVVAPYIAAQEAIKHWETLPSTGGKKIFIYTGNATNVIVLPVPLMLNAGMGKSASAYWLGVADGAYAAKGYRFFYADQRTADGKLAGQALSGPAHADFYAHLAGADSQDTPWHATFAEGKGYVKF